MRTRKCTVNIVECLICKQSRITLENYTSCIRCNSNLQFHALGEKLRLEIDDYNKLKAHKHIIITSNLALKYNIRKKS